MINIIGPTEQEARQIYTEAERTLNEKNAEIDRENEKRKKVNAKIETFKKWEDKLYNIGLFLWFICIIFAFISIFTLEYSTFFLVSSCIMLVIGLLLIRSASIWGKHLKIKDTFDLIDMLDYYSIDDYLPVAYDYYELCQKYGQPIKIELDDDYSQIDLVFADTDNTIVKECLDLGNFECVEKYKLSKVTIDLINKTIHIPYEIN